MIRLDVGDRLYYVEFRHLRRPRMPFTRAITTCVIVAVLSKEPTAIQFIAIGTTACDEEDNFSRRAGRLKAFKNAVLQCGALSCCRLMMLSAYMQHDPDRPAPPQPARRKLSPEEKAERWAAGWEKRALRWGTSNHIDLTEAIEAAKART